MERTIVPFSKVSKQSFSTPDSKKNDSYQVVTQNQFKNMLSINDSLKPKQPSLLGGMLYDLSLGLRSLNDVLEKIKFFKYNAPLNLYSYSSLLELIQASVKCAPDAILALLCIAKKMVQMHNWANPKHLNKLIKITKNLIRADFVYVSYGEKQEKAQEKLKIILQIFFNQLELPDECHNEGHYDTHQVEELMNEKLKNAQKRDSMTPEQLKINSDLLKLFDSYESLYFASLSVFQAMQTHQDFDLQYFLTLIPLSYSDFLNEAISFFSKHEYPSIEDILTE